MRIFTKAELEQASRDRQRQQRRYDTWWQERAVPGARVCFVGHDEHTGHTRMLAGTIEDTWEDLCCVKVGDRTWYVTPTGLWPFPELPPRPRPDDPEHP